VKSSAKQLSSIGALEEAVGFIDRFASGKPDKRNQPSLVMFPRAVKFSELRHGERRSTQENHCSGQSFDLDSRQLRALSGE
jgi:hypothetical protein